MTHVSYPGCYCADCVEGTPSARITGDKDRSVQSRAPTDLTARIAELEAEVTRLRGGGDRLSDALGKQMREKHKEMAEAQLWFGKAQEWKAINRRLAIECNRLRGALRYIADVAYVDHQSGNQNFEHLQSIARDGLAKQENPNHD